MQQINLDARSSHAEMMFLEYCFEDCQVCCVTSSPYMRHIISAMMSLEYCFEDRQVWGRWGLAHKLTHSLSHEHSRSLTLARTHTLTHSLARMTVQVPQVLRVKRWQQGGMHSIHVHSIGTYICICA